MMRGSIADSRHTKEPRVGNRGIKGDWWKNKGMRDARMKQASIVRCARK